MAERLTSYDDSTEEDSGNAKGRKQKAERGDTKIERRVSAPLLVRQPEETKPNSVFQPPKSFIDRMLGTAAKTEAKPPAAKEAEKVEAESVQSETHEAERGVAAADERLDETIAHEAERSVAEDLSSGEEVSLHDVELIAPEREEHVIEEALELATAEEANETVEAATNIASTAEAPSLPETKLQYVSPELPDIERDEDKGETVVAQTHSAVPFSRPPEAQPVSTLQGYNAYRPNTWNARGNVPMTPNVQPIASAKSPEQMIKKAVDDAEWEGRINGRREGLLTGLLVGGGFEHFRHRRREKKEARRYKREQGAQQKRVERLEKDYETARLTQESEAARVAAGEAENKLAKAAEREARLKELEALKQTKERVAQQQAQEAKPTAEDELAVGEGHHVERSAWHNIEVDEHGKAVKEAAFEYGHEYYNERAHEITPQQQLDEAAGEVALVAAALSESSDSQPPQPPQPPEKTVSAAEQTPTAGPFAKESKTTFKTIVSPPTTLAGTLAWFAVLVVILILIVVVTHSR